MKHGLTILLFSLFAVSTNAQCPPNIDFESGSWSGWTTDYGGVVPDTVQRVELISSANATMDHYGQFITKNPTGGSYSVRLGYPQGGLFDRISYEFVVPANQPNFSLTYYYAVVLQSAGHSREEDPRFTVLVENVTRNETVPCFSFDYISDSYMPGFQQSPVDDSVYYKGWDSSTVMLRGMAGETVRLNFTATGCTRGAHFGYAYIDVKSECAQPVKGLSYCKGDTLAKLTGPPGFQYYNWYDSTGVQLLGTGAQVYVNPPVSDSFHLFLELVPYPGYGCPMVLPLTAFANLNLQNLGGPNKNACAPVGIKIGTPPLNSVQYSWSPAADLNDATLAMPTVLASGTQNYVLTATSLGGGCQAKDTVKVTNQYPDTKLTILGDSAICIGSGRTMQLSVANAANIAWYYNDVLLQQNVASIMVGQPGIYYAQVYNTPTCKGTTRKQVVQQVDQPVAGFSFSPNAVCWPNSTVDFSDAGLMRPANTLYHWSFGDGQFSTDRNPTKFYDTTGDFLVRQIVSVNGCRDTAQHTITILPGVQPNFTAKDICRGSAVPIENLSIVKGTANVQYQWMIGSQSANGHAPSVVINQSGELPIRLVANVLGCADTFSTIKNIFVEEPTPGLRLQEVNPPFNFPTTLSARKIANTISWAPFSYLDNYFSHSPIFKGLLPQQYLIEQTTALGCTTVDTLLVKPVKLIAIYVPTAFTPNFDGLNDEIKPILFGIDKLHSFSIYDRYGTLVFATSVPNKGWNGRIRGIEVGIHTFVWTVEATDVDGKKQFKKGSFTLLK